MSPTDHVREDIGDCGGKGDGGDGGEGDKHQFTCSSYRHLAMILWPGYYDTEVTFYLDFLTQCLLRGLRPNLEILKVSQSIV